MSINGFRKTDMTVMSQADDEVQAHIICSSEHFIPLGTKPSQVKAYFVVFFNIYFVNLIGKCGSGYRILKRTRHN